METAGSHIRLDICPVCSTAKRYCGKSECVVERIRFTPRWIIWKACSAVKQNPRQAPVLRITHMDARSHVRFGTARPAG